LVELFYLKLCERPALDAIGAETATARARQKHVSQLDIERTIDENDILLERDCSTPFRLRDNLWRTDWRWCERHILVGKLRQLNRLLRVRLLGKLERKRESG